jgi:hypothetical protein
MKTRSIFALLALATLLAGCAGPSGMVRKSQKAYDEGNDRKAYEWARKALDKEPDLASARDAYRAAATRVAGNWKERVRGMASVDSIDAARQCLRLTEFRREVARYGVALPDDPRWTAEEQQLRQHAAAWFYRQGTEDLANARPKHAYDDFIQCREFVETHRSVTRMIARAYEQAVTEVAILPFDNETRLPGLGRELTDACVSHVVEQLAPGTLRFTKLIAPERLYGVMTVAQMDRPAEFGARIAERVGADRYVVGRVGGLTTDTNTGFVHTQVWRRMAERDTSGGIRYRYVSVPFNAVTRQREVQVSWEFDVVEASTGHVIAHRGDKVTAHARTVYSLFVSEGRDDDYCLIPPDGHRPAGYDVEGAQKSWQASFGSWSVSKIVESSRNANSRSKYRRDYRGEFSPRRATRPVFLNDLPPAEDLAYVALEDVWEPMFDTLRELDGRE